MIAAARIASAAFFAPPISTSPTSGFPPLIIYCSILHLNYPISSFSLPTSLFCCICAGMQQVYSPRTPTPHRRYIKMSKLSSSYNIRGYYTTIYKNVKSFSQFCFFGHFLRHFFDFFQHFFYRFLDLASIFTDRNIRVSFKQPDAFIIQILKRLSLSQDNTTFFRTF